MQIVFGGVPCGGSDQVFSNDYFQLYWLQFFEGAKISGI